MNLVEQNYFIKAQKVADQRCQQVAFDNQQHLKPVTKCH
jgi:hypothetical protein